MARRSARGIPAIPVTLLTTLSIDQATGQAGREAAAPPATDRTLDPVYPLFNDGFLVLAHLPGERIDIITFVVDRETVYFDGVPNDHLAVPGKRFHR